MKRYRRCRAWIQRHRSYVRELRQFGAMLSILREDGFMIVTRAPGPVMTTYSDPQVPLDQPWKAT